MEIPHFTCLQLTDKEKTTKSMVESAIESNNPNSYSQI